MIRFILLILPVLLCACNSTGATISEEVIELPKSISSKEENIRFMIDTYGLTPEELEGLDVTRFLHDYQLRERDYSAEEIRDILRAQSGMYADDGTTDLFSVFSETGGTLKSEDTVDCIAFYLNSGSLIQQTVFDIENKVFYYDSAEPHPLSEEQVTALRELPEKWDIPSWESHCEGDEEPSTGHYKWKLVFQVADGDFRVYDGYTGDMSHLPKNFSNVRQVLDSIISTVE